MKTALSLSDSVVINRAERDITTAVKVYSDRTTDQSILRDISPAFIHRLAVDSTLAKKSLRAFLSRSSAWLPELDALKIPGELPAEINPRQIESVVDDILFPALVRSDFNNMVNIQRLREYVLQSEISDEVIEALKKIDAKAYKTGKKKTRVFRDCCKALGIADESAGSDFSRNFAKLSDMLNASPKKFTLYVSINPAHFLTMSNPKHDVRGSTLTSCHSLNSTEYTYNNGCTGYARDDVTMIAFTVADDEDPETFFNRKTTRQIYCYKPGNGILLQSRMYNTSGGTYGAARETEVYRNMIEKVISDLENVPNTWKIKESSRNYRDYAIQDDDFGGYADWTYNNFDARICILDALSETAEPLVIGKSGLCVSCADETSEGMYCEACNEAETCDDCGDRENEENMYFVYTRSRGWRDERHVCEYCMERNYTRCERCDDYYNNESMTEVQNGDYVCSECLSEFYEECEECGEWVDMDDTTRVLDECGYEYFVCEDCLSRNYTYCEECEEYRPDEMFSENRRICDDCAAKLEEKRDDEDEEDENNVA